MATFMQAVLFDSENAKIKTFPAVPVSKHVEAGLKYMWQNEDGVHVDVGKEWAMLSYDADAPLIEWVSEMCADANEGANKFNIASAIRWSIKHKDFYLQ